MIKKLALWLCSFASLAVVSPAIEGKATYYHDDYEGKETAYGERYRSHLLTCATYEFPYGTKLLVTYISAAGTERSVIVRVNDRGPSKEYREQGRIIDLSKAAFRTLENLDRGVIKVRVQEVQ
jgi:rare lipoprotein A